MMNLLAPGEAIGPNSSAPEPVEAAPSLNEYGTTPSGAIVQPFRLPAETTVVAACAPPAITSATHAAANAPATLNFIPALPSPPDPAGGRMVRTPDRSLLRFPGKQQLLEPRRAALLEKCA